MRIAIVGSKGQVGWELTRRAPMFGHEVLAWDQDELDITDATAVDQTLTASGAAVVINAAAYTAVDRAEQEPELALAVNRDGPAHLAAACARLNIPLLHISTDYVFDGCKIGPYVEDDPASPLGVYGRGKWEGDEAVRRLLPRHLILRVSWVFGIQGHNFVKTILRLAREREELRAVRPTPATLPTRCWPWLGAAPRWMPRRCGIPEPVGVPTITAANRPRRGTVLPVRSSKRPEPMNHCRCKP